MTEINPKAQLYAKISRVMAAVNNVEKRGHNDFHRYDYAMEADILYAIRPALISEGLVILPSVTSERRDTIPGSKGDDFVTTLMVDFTIADTESGETVTVSFPGTGQDKGDKGAYKALTGALKYMLMKTFALPTGDDPEGDTNVDQRNSESTPKAAPKRQTTPKSSGNGTVYACEECGEVLVDTTGKDGKPFTAANKAKFTKNKTGRVLCYDHYQEAIAA